MNNEKEVNVKITGRLSTTDRILLGTCIALNTLTMCTLGYILVGGCKKSSNKED